MVCLEGISATEAMLSCGSSLLAQVEVASKKRIKPSDGEGSIKYGDGQIEVQTASSRKKYSYPRHVLPEVKNEGVFAKFLPHE